VIARFWRGWASGRNADAYEELLKREIFPGIHRIDGYLGAYLLRRDTADGVEFATLTLWESLAAVRAFAGEDHERAVVPPEARELLEGFDERSAHYEIVVTPPRPSEPPSA
jgi:heme-degrading monooxygenase HmoA